MGAMNISIKKWEILYFKIKIIPFIINFRSLQVILEKTLNKLFSDAPSNFRYGNNKLFS